MKGKTHVVKEWIKSIIYLAVREVAAGIHYNSPVILLMFRIDPLPDNRDLQFSAFTSDSPRSLLIPQYISVVELVLNTE